MRKRKGQVKMFLVMQKEVKKKLIVAKGVNKKKKYEKKIFFSFLTRKNSDGALNRELYINDEGKKKIFFVLLFQQKSKILFGCNGRQKANKKKRGKKEEK